MRGVHPAANGVGVLYLRVVRPTVPPRFCGGTVHVQTICFLAHSGRSLNAPYAHTRPPRVRRFHAYCRAENYPRPATERTLAQATYRPGSPPPPQTYYRNFIFVPNAGAQGPRSAACGHHRRQIHLARVGGVGLDACLLGCSCPLTP